MTIRAQELFDVLAEELKRTKQSLSAIREENLTSPQRLTDLAKQRTDAFVDLAQHYLPSLSYETMDSAWGEVQSKIRDLFLQKEDVCRRLRAKRDTFIERRVAAEGSLGSLRSEHEKAELDLGSKVGNFHRELRLDSRVAACFAQVEQLDEQIDQGIQGLELATDHAKKKLPDYQESELFGYLQERGYGTPAYQARGLERRWDRWVARLIDYSNSKKSYEYLVETPEMMKQLIDEKRQRYAELLRELDDVRFAAEEKFGVHRQRALCHELNQQLLESEKQLKDLRRDEANAQRELDSAENIHGEQYQQALDVYRDFLMTLDSEVLRVYAECTASPVDDEICARLRRIQEDIAREESESTLRMEQLADLDRYLKSVYQLTDRLHVYVRRSTIPLRCPSDFVLQQHLDSLRSGAQDTSEVWAAMRRAIAQQFGIDVEELRASGEYEPASTLDESFLSVIAHEANEGTKQSREETSAEILDIVSVPADQAEDDGHQIGYRTIAVCRSEVDAAWLAERLQSDGVRCFVHSPISGGTDVQSGMCYVMVSPRDLAKARKMIETLRENDQF